MFFFSETLDDIDGSCIVKVVQYATQTKKLKDLARLGQICMKGHIRGFFLHNGMQGN